MDLETIIIIFISCMVSSIASVMLSEGYLRKKHLVIDKRFLINFIRPAFIITFIVMLVVFSIAFIIYILGALLKSII